MNTAMNTAGRVHKTIRLERDLAESVKALSVEGETETATYCRVLSAGVEALRGTEQRPRESAGDASGALVASLQAHIETLRADNERLGAQLDVKDKQIEALSVLTAQAQQATTKAIEAPQPEPEAGGGHQVEEKRRGWLSRLFG